MNSRTPRFTRADTLFPYTAVCRSGTQGIRVEEGGMGEIDQSFPADRCLTGKAHGAEHMPGQSTMGRQEGQAGEMRGIGGLRPPKPAPHIAIMFHHRIAAMCVCVGALVARLTLVGVEFRRDSDAIFAPDEIWVRIEDRKSKRLNSSH